MASTVGGGLLIVRVPAQTQINFSVMTGRDTNPALVIFNRKKNLSAVLQQIPGLVTSHLTYSG